MKLFIFLAMTLSFSVSHASKSADAINDRSVVILMKQNPTAYYDLSDENTASSVNSLIATGMLSKEFANGTMNLAQIFNSCEDIRSAAPASRVYACRLILTQSDRNVSSDGHLSAAEPMSESAIVIDYIYIVDEYGKESVSDARYFLAG